MNLYCYIENGEIVGSVQQLPTCWKNISNFYSLDDETLKSYGWLPYFSISENREIFVSSSREILEDKVIETIITRDRTPQEIEDKNNEELINKWNNIRSRRNELLRQSDIYVLVDRWNSMTIEKQQEWSIYRQELRDLPNKFSNPDSVVFPNVPN